MKFVLISFIYFISLHYVSSQYEIYSQIFRPYNSYRYAQAQSMFRYPQPTAVRYLQPTAARYLRSTAVRYPPPTVARYGSYGSYKSFTPENRSLVITKKVADVDEMQSHLDNLLSRMKSTMMEMNIKQEQSATDQSSKTTNNPNDKIYKGKLTRKTSASNRSASV
ncbi:uncharacterized protein LOC100574588 [Acyrthosiphon pisum]|uniref:Uncharacterized protein n=1 Tax=Acyrthosiphon pisum TaxID=7029 RepID=A0A8R1W5Y8_ACYPI|nr:uncharacterized protein LOC100574588 [Acyrthosiphon pisum]|eukprot:XP_003243919.1 PREDICTED: uncharacterized protein LOC100574588 [Acyrthosiphon pisum]